MSLTAALLLASAAAPQAAPAAAPPRVTFDSRSLRIDGKPHPWLARFATFAHRHGLNIPGDDA